MLIPPCSPALRILSIIPFCSIPTIVPARGQRICYYQTKCTTARTMLRFMCFIISTSSLISLDRISSPSSNEVTYNTPHTACLGRVVRQLDPTREALVCAYHRTLTHPSFFCPYLIYLHRLSRHLICSFILQPFNSLYICSLILFL